MHYSHATPVQMGSVAELPPPANKVCAPAELWSAHLLPALDYLSRVRYACCNTKAREEAMASAGLYDARTARAEALLLRAGAPPGLVLRLDVSLAWKWMERRDSAFAVESGYVDYLTPLDFGPNHPVLYGRDVFDRFCLAASFTWRNETSVACLFQRYSDDRSLFVNCRDRMSGDIEVSKVCVDWREPDVMAGHHARILDLVSRGSCDLNGEWGACLSV